MHEQRGTYVAAHEACGCALPPVLLSTCCLPHLALYATLSPLIFPHTPPPRLASPAAANPTGILLSSVMMLRYLRLPNFADRMERAIFSTIAGGVKTADVGGSASTTAFVDEIVKRLASDSHSGKDAKKSKGVSKAV